MIKIGDKYIFHIATFYMFEHEVAELELYPRDDEGALFLSVAFDNTQQVENAISSVKIVGNEQKGTLTFSNWKYLSVNVIQQPIYFATTDRDEQVSLIGGVTRTGDLFKVELQFMRGGVR